MNVDRVGAPLELPRPLVYFLNNIVFNTEEPLFETRLESDTDNFIV